ncbi:uncharacterized protein LOC124892946 [Capsicum annuum]|uniref:uncharacterized protein LOC124892946 n=1 Tax=Capsicum annuum TaxID=4072 RepID=UPI001FB078CD|nr:uncharacterized protein LOC124892946 [Capsicum annuum]
MCIECSEYDSVALTIVEMDNQYALYVAKMEVKNFITDCKNTEIMVSQIYKDKETLVSVMARHTIANGFNTKAKRSDKKSYVLICHNEDCQWVMKASCMNESKLFVIKIFISEHSCSLRDRVLNNMVATSNFVSEFTAPKLINHKRIHTPADIIEEMKVIYGVDINYMKAWRAKEKAIVMLRGGPADGYRKIPRYIYMLNQVYPQSHIQMHKATDNEFKDLFIALRSMIRGFEFCRPVVVVDGAYLSGPYEGTSVSASTLDGVDIERGTCKCGRYQIDEIPCPHEIVVLKSKNVDVKDYGRYCSELYKPQTTVKTYELPIVPMPDKKDWNVPCFVGDEEVLPPK